MRPENSILCTKGAKWAFSDRVWSLQYESKASKHEEVSPNSLGSLNLACS